MKQNLINDVVQAMLPYLNNAQTEKLQAVMQHKLFNYDVVGSESKDENEEQNLVEIFLAAKQIEGCSEKSLRYYNATIQSMINGVVELLKKLPIYTMIGRFFGACFFYFQA